MVQVDRDLHIQTLLSLGSGKSEKEIRDLLEHHNWNPDAAAGALFDIHVQSSTSTGEPSAGWGADASQSQWEPGSGWDDTNTGLKPADWGSDIGEPSRGRSMERGSSREIGALNLVGSDSQRQMESEPSKNANDVIDLTVDEGEEDLSKALQLSLEEANKQSNSTTFKPSDREPSVHWAMVPSNVPAGQTLPADDHDIEMTRAVEASLRDAYQDDLYEELEPEQKIRKGGRPLALRTTEGPETWGALILQAIYFIPQVRAQLAPMTFPPDSMDGAAATNPLGQLYIIQQFYTLLTYGQMGYYAIAPGILNFSGASAAGPTYQELTDDYYEKVAYNMEQALFPVQILAKSPWPRLFHFRIAEMSDNVPAGDFDRSIERPLVKVEYDPCDPLCNDLMTCLTSEYLRVDSSGRSVHSIEQSSDVIAFNLRRRPAWATPATSKGNDEAPFNFPGHLYLDRFMSECREVSERTFQQQKTMNEEISNLETEKTSLTQEEGKEVLPSLRSTIYYLEEVSESRKDPALVARNIAACDRLKKVIEKIEGRVEEIDRELKRLRESVNSLFDTPDLQRHRYDLRAALYHDGFFGRTHAYAYVRDYRSNTWWKICDHQVVEITEETVLTDSTGLHLGGGPYFLIYSRNIDEANYPRETWPDHVRGEIKTENEKFRLSLPPEAAAALLEAESPDLLEVDTDFEAIKVEPMLTRSDSCMSLDD